MTTLTLTRPRAPRAAFANMVFNEARLAWRQPAGMIAGTGIALLLLVIFGEIPVFRQPSASLGGYSPFDIYIPILMSFSIAMIAFTYLPGPLVSYRELGILRRLSTTPVPAYWVLAAQIAVQACLMAVTLALLITVSIVFFGISAPKNPAAMVLAIALTMAALFAIGLAIAALARTSGAARGLMAAALYPMMFFSGLYYPVQLMPAVIQDISHYTRSARPCWRSATRGWASSRPRSRCWSSRDTRWCSATWPSGSSAGNSGARMQIASGRLRRPWQSRGCPPPRLRRLGIGADELGGLRESNYAQGGIQI